MRLGWERLGNNATRGDIAGQFLVAGLVVAGQSVARRGTTRQKRELGAASKRNFPRRYRSRWGWVRHGAARLYVTGDGNPGHFLKHQEVPHHAGQRSTG